MADKTEDINLVENPVELSAEEQEASESTVNSEAAENQEALSAQELSADELDEFLAMDDTDDSEEDPSLQATQVAAERAQDPIDEPALAEMALTPNDDFSDDEARDSDEEEWVVDGVDTSLSEELEAVDGIETEGQGELEAADLEGSELDGYASEEIENLEFIEEERIQSIIESILFATEKPQSIAVIKQAFVGTTVGTKDIKRVIQQLMVEYAGAQRGVTIEEVTGGYQLRTKSDNMDYLRNMIKVRPFKLSGPALEVLSIVAYKQPCAKIEVDEVRGVESGHLMRGLMEKGILAFAGKSDLPGKPMLYQTTRKFLEVFGLRNLSELPTLSQIDELIPEGMDPEEGEAKQTLGDVADGLAQDAKSTYSEASDELEKISDTLSAIDTSSEFFEQEKERERRRRDEERAQDIEERLMVDESEVEDKDKRWLAKYQAKIQEEIDAEQAAQAAAELAAQERSDEASNEQSLEATEFSESEIDDLAAADADDESPIAATDLEAGELSAQAIEQAGNTEDAIDEASELQADDSDAAEWIEEPISEGLIEDLQDLGSLGLEGIDETVDAATVDSLDEPVAEREPPKDAEI